MAERKYSLASGHNGAKCVKIPVNKRKLLNDLYSCVNEDPAITQTELHTVTAGFDQVDSDDYHIEYLDISRRQVTNLNCGFRDVQNDNAIQDNERKEYSNEGPPATLEQEIGECGKYTKYDLVLNILCIIFYLVDVVTDSLLAISYYREKRLVFFGLTMAFMMVPSIVMNICSFFWYLDDYKQFRRRNNKLDSNWIFMTVLHVIFSFLQLGPVLRYASAIHYGIKSCKEDQSRKKQFYYVLSLEEEKDSCMLRLFEAALEAGPQLILQLFVLLTQAPEFKDPIQKFFAFRTVILQISSIFTSWFGMSWAHVAYHRALRLSRSDKSNMSIVGSLLYFLWRLFETGPRVIALAAFAEVVTTWVFVVTGIHWLIMTCWYGFQRIYEKPMFGEEWRYLDHAFNMVCASVSLFGFLNVKEGHTRYRCTIYYLLYYTENVVMILIWFFLTKNKSEWYYLPAIFIVILGFFLCVAFQSVYYLWFHPTSDVRCFLEKENFFESVCFVPKIKPRTRKRSAIDELLNTSAELVHYKPSPTLTTISARAPADVHYKPPSRSTTV